MGSSEHSSTLDCTNGAGELTFQNLRYIVTVFTNSSDVLSIEAEQKNDGARWRGSFSSHNIEDMTQRTGNFKKFAIFVKMLQSAILQDSDSVFVDLLTYQDLELLKSRIHYPLPLAQEEVLEPDILKRTIKRLRIEVESLKKQLQFKEEQGTSHETTANHSGMDKDENEKLRKENTRLLMQLRCLEDSMMQHLGYKENSFMEDDRKRLTRDLAMYQKKCSVLLAKLDVKMMSQREVQGLEDKVDQFQRALKSEKDNRKKWVTSLTREKIALSEQVRRARDSERAMRLRFREMEREMGHLKRRLKLQGIQNVDGTFGRIRVNSLLGSRKTTPVSSRDNSPSHIRHSKTGSRASSCPTFGSLRNSSSNKDELRLPIYKEYLARAPTSLPSPPHFRDSPRYGTGASTRHGDYLCSTPPKVPHPLHRKIKEAPKDMPRVLKQEATSGSSRSPSNYSMRLTQTPPVISRMEEVSVKSTISNSMYTPEGNCQDLCGMPSQASSPRKVLQEVKSKLAEYARMQGIPLCGQ